MHSKHTLFISDLHLSEDFPATAELLFQFLKNTAQEADALYILGDFFEVWVGDDDRSDFNERIKDALREYTDTGIPTYFMRGNRDFLIRKRFAKETGVTLLKEPSVINLYGQRILLLHGDSLCTLDQKHQKSRKIMHNTFYQTAVLHLLPLKLRRYYGNRFRSASAERKSNMADNIMDVTFEEVVSVLSNNQTKIVIHGHTHRPAIHKFTVNNEAAQRIVLGAWHDKGNYLKIDQEANMALLDFA